MDKFEPKTKGIPHCKLLALLEDPSKRKPLLYTINLQGAKDPPNFFTVYIEGKPCYTSGRNYEYCYITHFGLVDKFSMTAASIPQANVPASFVSPQAGI